MTERDIDKHFPLHDGGAEPPGKFVDGVWRGPSAWRTQHGGAVVRWQIGHPINVSNAKVANGSLTEAEFSLDYGWRRASPGSGREWTYGQVEIAPNAVTFTDDAEQPGYVPPPLGPVPDLEAELARDAAFLADLRELDFSVVAYSALRNTRFSKAGTVWECGERQAAYLIADMRAQGNSYMDYFPSGEVARNAKTAAAFDKMDAHLRRLGWTRVPN